MGLFQHLEGESAVIVESGVYKQVDLYSRDGYIYAKASGGFIRLNMDGSTTKAKCRLDFLDYTGELARDIHGRLCAPNTAGATPLPSNSQQLLLGK